MDFSDNYIIETEKDQSIINAGLSPIQQAQIFINACGAGHDDSNLNERADMIQRIVGPGFYEIGTGTNRIALMKKNLVFKIALDVRGTIDNLTELNRSVERPEFLAKAYESNGLITVCEYVNVMDQYMFMENQDAIRQVLEIFDEDYIFADMGLIAKNAFNWGWRSSPDEEVDGTIVALDYGYMYPKRGQEHVLTCPNCGGELKSNNNYTGYVCRNRSCRAAFSGHDILRRRNLAIESMEQGMDDMIDVMRHSNFTKIMNLKELHDDPAKIQEAVELTKKYFGSRYLSPDAERD